MAHQFNATSTIMAGYMQPTPSRQKYAGRLLLGYGQSGDNSITVKLHNKLDIFRHVNRVFLLFLSCLLRYIPGGANNPIGIRNDRTTG